MIIWSIMLYDDSFQLCGKPDDLQPSGERRAFLNLDDVFGPSCLLNVAAFGPIGSHRPVGIRPYVIVGRAFHQRVDSSAVGW